MKFKSFFGALLLLASFSLHAAELNNTSTGQWSQTDGSNTSSPPDGWPAGVYPNQVEGIGQSTMGAIKRFWDRINGVVTTTGASGHYVYTPTNTSYPTSMVNGEEYSWKAHQNSAGADDLNINGKGAYPLYKVGSSGPVAIAAGDVQAGARIISQFDSALNGGAGAHLIIAGLSASSGGVNTGTSGQLAYYAANGNAVSGTNGLPSGTTATTQSASDSSTKVATTAFVNGTALTLASGTTAVTQSSSDNSTKVATTSFVQSVLGISCSFGNSGYCILGGLYLEWGTSSGSSNPETINFPTAFPNAVYVIVASPTGSGAGVPRIPSKSTSSFSMGYANAQIASMWFAVGH